MAKLYLKFDKTVLKEFRLSQGVITIGRLPDNLVQVDNPAVSGHHARIYWETDHYVLEDNNSTNGTYINNRRVSTQELHDGDEVLVGKHTIAYKDSWNEEDDSATQKTPATVAAPRMDATMMLDTKKSREMLAQAQAQAAGGGAAAVAVPAKDRVATFTIMDGKTDQSQYVLASKLTMIGKSEMATIKLKGWFAPKAAAVIHRREGKYFLAQAEKGIKVKVNGGNVGGQHELNDGDIVEVAGVKATFSFNE